MVRVDARVRQWLETMTVTPARLALIVDPDAETRDRYGVILTAEASEIEYAEDGRDALAKAIGRPPRFMITETHLKFIHGYTLCALLRADPITANVRIVVITGDTSPDDIERARSSGADSVLRKPCQPEALLQAIAPGRDRSLISEKHLRVTPAKAASRQATFDAAIEPPTEQSSRSMVRAHRRYDTNTPPIAPPPLRCPCCDRPLQYLRSHIGGVSARLPEQWDYYTCRSACGAFQYRQRTRRLRRAQ